MSAFNYAWTFIKSMSPDDRYVGTMDDFNRKNPDAGPDDMPYKTQPCPVCKKEMPYDGHSGTDFCSPECEQIAIESSRNYQINQMKNQKQKEFLQAQLARMKQINPDAKYPDVR